MNAAPGFDPEHRVGYLLRRAFHRAKANTGARLRELGVTPTQAAALMTLRRDGARSQAELGRAIGMEPANVHGLVARLRTQRLVKTTAHPSDSRQVSVALSARGLGHIDAIAQRTAAAAEETLAPLAPGERAIFLTLLRRIALSEATSAEAPASPDRSDTTAPKPDTSPSESARR